MTKLFRIFLTGLAGWLVLFGCTPNSGKTTIPTIKPKECKNTFVLSGYDNTIQIKEFDPKSFEIKHLGSIEEKVYRIEPAAFYDCAHNSVVVPAYHESPVGILVYDLDHGTSTFVPNDKSVGDIVGRFKHGFMAYTKALMNRPYDPKDQCAEVYTRDDGSRFIAYTDMFFFDPGKKAFTKSWPFTILDFDDTEGDIVYEAGGCKRDLEHNTTEDILGLYDRFERWPRNSLRFSIKKIPYVLTAGYPLDAKDGQRLMDPYSLYRVYPKGHPEKVADFPTDGELKEIFSVDGHTIHVFSNAGMVYAYDLQSKKFSAKHIALSLPEDFELQKVNYMDNYFVMAFSHKRRSSDEYLAVADWNLSRYSPLYRDTEYWNEIITTSAPNTSVHQ